MTDLILDERLLGAIPSPFDPNDWQLPLDTASPLPSKFRAPLLGPVLNQGQTGRCVAFSGTGVRQQQERADGDWPVGWPPLDPQWLYDQAQAIDGIPLPHDGTTIRAALQILTHKGEPLLGKPGSEGHFKVREYHAVPYTEDAIKRALVQFGPVWIAIRFNSAWFHPFSGVIPSPSGSWIGGHAIYVFGFDDSVAGGSGLIRNSWSQRWALNGNAYFPWRYLLPALHDAWSTSDVLGDTK